ncbi:nicotinate (nicotinamide) nucleotide adenylyltransferase [Prevotella histicola]
MKKIGIFGGSFNPIHNGHIALAKAFLKEEKLDEVWFMVSPQNPFKVNQHLLSDHLRLEMVRKALGNEPQLIVSDYEFHLPRPSYTWLTLQHLKEDYPQDNFTLLVGGDNWAAFDRWYHADDILSNYQIVVFPRRGENESTVNLTQGVHFLNAPLIDISSTEIRRYVQEGRDISAFIPASIQDDVLRYYRKP